MSVRCQNLLGTRVLLQHPVISLPSASHTGRAQTRHECLFRLGAALRTSELSVREDPQGVKGSVHNAQQSLALPLALPLVSSLPACCSHGSGDSCALP